VIGVTIQRGENIDRALKRFKKKYERTGILREYKNRTAYVKPSMEKRLQQIKSSRRQYRISKEMNR
jgi:small subunit ribosomal protein S21